MTPSPSREEAIQARLDAATPGPWSWEVSADRHWVWVGTDSGDGFWDQPVAKCSDDDTAEFISWSREDVAYLLAENEKLRARIDKALALLSADPRWNTQKAIAALTGEGNTNA